MRTVAGLDEAGRGCLAGPVSIGYVILPETVPDSFSELNDSKLLPEEIREELFSEIQKHAVFFCAVHISNRRIDAIGINPAIELAMVSAHRRALHAGSGADLLAIDGNYKFTRFGLEFPRLRTRSIIRGDSRVQSIAAASIVAKVTRDRRMARYDAKLPGFDFGKHKGYGTLYHRQRIEELGRSPLHRLTFGLDDVDEDQLLIDGLFET